jgi:hypothetical protein
MNETKVYVHVILVRWLLRGLVGPGDVLAEIQNLLPTWVDTTSKTTLNQTTGSMLHTSYNKCFRCVHQGGGGGGGFHPWYILDWYCCSWYQRIDQAGI